MKIKKNIVMTVGMACLQFSCQVRKEGAGQASNLEATTNAQGNTQGKKSSTTIIECTGDFEQKTQTLQVKINAKGKIIQWSSDVWANVITGDWVSIFGQTADDSGAEYDNLRTLRNGVNLLTIGTSADEFTFSLSSDLKRGGFKYTDTGSGNGNKKFDMTCIEK